MTEEVKEVYQGGYITVYDDGTMTVIDGLGCLDTMERDEVKNLYEALRTIFREGE